jgi:ATP-binding cassette subfamily B protein
MAGGWGMMRSFRQDESLATHKLKPGTVRRITRFAAPYWRQIGIFLLLVVADAVLVVATPLLLRTIVDDGVLKGDRGVVTTYALLVALVALLLDAALSLIQRWYSAQIGEGGSSICAPGVPRTCNGCRSRSSPAVPRPALISRLNSDVIGAQQALTSTLAGVVSNVITLVSVATVMFLLSWHHPAFAAHAAAVLVAGEVMSAAGCRL